MLEWSTLKIRSFPALLISGFVLATATLALSGCNVEVLYKAPQYGYAGRPVPPSKLLQRVLAAYTANGTSGGLEIIDGLRDLRGNIQNTVKGFTVSGYSEAQPVTIFNFPEQTLGYVLSLTDGNLTAINYSKESSAGTAANFGGYPPSAAAAPVGGMFAGAAQQAGLLVIAAGGSTYDLNLPNVNKVVVNQGDSVVLAMVKNSDTLYRVVKLPATSNPILPPGYVDCEPVLLPVFCVVPVAGTYDRPSDVSFSLDGTTAYVLNSGPENGGTTASVELLQTAPLNINIIPTVNPLSVGAPSPLSPLPVPNPIPVPGGVTASLSDGTSLYLSGQQLQTSGQFKGLFAGNLTVVNLSTYLASAPISISDGYHTKMLFADDNTLWIGSTSCSNGVRAATATAELAATGTTDQAGNYNCLTLVKRGSATPTAQIVPAVTQSATNAVPVPYPNTNQNQFYYGSVTGLCWVQNYHKVYTAYGGQVHAFYTGSVPGTTPIIPGSDLDANGNVNGGPAGSEINNINLTVQGTVYDVAYMDAQSNSSN
jgi:hypothetical protein